MYISLYDHQLEAMHHMRNGCILCGETGVGKSRTAVAYYYWQNGGVLDIPQKLIPFGSKIQDLYIITTAKKRDDHDWIYELAPFSLGIDDRDKYDHKVFIDSWHNIQKYKDVENAFFIFDEHKAMGTGPWAKTFINISKHNKWIILTATPGDVWLDYCSVFIANGFFKNKSEFERKHVKYRRYVTYPEIEDYLNRPYLEFLRKKILVDMEDFRKTVPHHMDIYTSYDVVGYKDLMRYRWDYYHDKPIETAAYLCYLLRTLVNTSADRQLKLLEILEHHDKAIIFYNFDSELDILRGLNYGPGVKIAEWNGHKHMDIPTSDKWVYLVNYMSGAEGWNCTLTDTMIFYSQTYSYKTLHQACGRIDRMNTPFVDLYYYHLKSRSGIDLAISRALENKEEFNETRYIRGFNRSKIEREKKQWTETTQQQSLGL